MYIEASDCRYWARIEGSGPRLLFLAGSGSDLRYNCDSIFDALAAYFEICIFDQRGLGQTIAPPPPWTMADYADDAHHVLDALGWDSAHIAGYSFGGMTALNFALAYPQKVQKLVLGATSPGGHLGASYPLHELYDLPPRARIIKSMQISNAQLKPVDFDPPFSELEREIDERLAADEKQFPTDEARQNHRALFEARRQHDVSDHLAEINAPTLIVSGADDSLASRPGQEAMAKIMPHAELLTVPGSHGFINENPQFFDGLIRFLKA